MKDVKITFHDENLKVKTFPIVLNTGITFSIQTSLSVFKEWCIESMKYTVVKNETGSGSVIIQAIHLCDQPYIEEYITLPVINSPTTENLLEPHMLSPCVEVSLYNLNSNYKIGLFSGFRWLTFPILLYNGKEITSKEYYAISVIKSLDAILKFIQSDTKRETSAAIEAIEREFKSDKVLALIDISNAYFIRSF